MHLKFCEQVQPQSSLHSGLKALASSLRAAPGFSMLSLLFGKKLSKKSDGAVVGRQTRVVPVEAASPSRSKGVQNKIRRAPSSYRLGQYAAYTSDKSHAQARSETINTLIKQMHGNMTSLRQRLTDVESIHAQLQESEGTLQQAMNASEESKEVLNIFVEEMKGDFALMERKPFWTAQGAIAGLVTRGSNASCLCSPSYTWNLASRCVYSGCLLASRPRKHQGCSRNHARAL